MGGLFNSSKLPNLFSGSYFLDLLLYIMQVYKTKKKNYWGVKSVLPITETFFRTVYACFATCSTSAPAKNIMNKLELD